MCGCLCGVRGGYALFPSGQLSFLSFLKKIRISYCAISGSLWSTSSRLVGLVLIR